jgi:diaminopimelate decarboxylase
MPTEHFSYRKEELTCESVPLRDAVSHFGTPLYLYSRATILDRCREIEEAFGGHPHLACYAVKANANPALLGLIRGEGYGADVGSAGELALALRAGFRPEVITFSGVGKRDDEVEEALARGIHAFAVESEQEIAVIDQIAGRLGTKGRILLRVNLDLDAGGHAYVSTSRKQNKFGVPVQQARDVLLRASARSHIEVRGVHSHIGSQITRGEVFVSGARSIERLVGDLREAGLRVPDLDFGGGYGVQYHGFLRDRQLPDEHPESADLSTAGMIRAVLPILTRTGCALSIQPGRAIVAQSGVLLVRVLYRKETGEKTFLIVDGGMNDLIRPSLYHAHHQIVPVSLRGAPHERVDVVGPVCESGDFFAQDRMLPRCDRGDLLALMGAGAYGFVLASNYNARLRPAEVLVDGSTMTLIRERETLEDLERGTVRTGKELTVSQS